METKIDIPEHIQQICREFAKVAQANGLLKFSGSFSGSDGWHGEVNFSWQSGRHYEDSNELRISSNFFVHTKVNIKSQPHD